MKNSKKMAKILSFLLLACVVAIEGSVEDGTCKTIVERYGYKCQEHTVTTEDGYILSMQRIPEGRHEKYQNDTKRQPVLLQHGIMMDGTTWLMNNPEESIAYLLADNGYDVWISNTRGTRWSRKHTSLQANDPVFWNWSWDELVKYDLPSFSEYVYQQTGQKMHYVGHSLGTLTALACLSEGNMVDLWKSASLLCPIGYLSRIAAITKGAATPLLGESNYWLGMPEFNPKEQSVSALVDSVCRAHGVNCYDLMSTFTGMNCCLNSSTMSFYLKYGPQSTSTKNMIHLAQMIRNDNIAKYDYEDYASNMMYYRQVKPPTYDMSSIPNDFPLFLTYGGRDALADVGDVEKLLDDLEDHDEDKKTVLFLVNYAHMDFVMATDPSKVFDPLLNFFNQHSNP